MICEPIEDAMARGCRGSLTGRIRVDLYSLSPATEVRRLGDPVDTSRVLESSFQMDTSPRNHWQPTNQRTDATRPQRFVALSTGTSWGTMALPLPARFSRLTKRTPIRLVSARSHRLHHAQHRRIHNCDHHGQCRHWHNKPPGNSGCIGFYEVIYE